MVLGNEVLYIRSSDRSLGTAGSFTVTLPKTYTGVTSIALVSAEIPYSFGNVTDALGVGVTFIQSVPTGFAADYVLPIGSYTIVDIQTHMLAWLQSTFPALSISAVNYNKIYGKLSVVFGTGTLAVTHNALYPKIGACAVLGVDTEVATVSASQLLSFPFVANLQPLSCIMMKLNNLPSNILTTGGGNGTFRIQLNSPPSSIIMVNNALGTNNTVTFVNPIPSLNTLSIQMVHGDNNNLNFRGCDWSASIKITSIE